MNLLIICFVGTVFLAGLSYFGFAISTTMQANAAISSEPDYLSMPEREKMFGRYIFMIRICAAGSIMLAILLLIVTIHLSIGYFFRPASVMSGI